MAVNNNDERIVKVEAEKQTALNELNSTYDDLINKSDKYYQDQIDAQENWKNEQTKLQQEKTNLAIEKIEQDKAQAHKDYLKEQTAAHVDYTKAVSDYGVNAEKMASNGLLGSGYSESAKVGMYNTYQLRVATAKDSISRADLNFSNAIKDAQLQNNSILADIAFQTQQKQYELSLAGFQYKNQLILEKADKQREISNTYWSRYQDVLDQINTENAQAISAREIKLAEEKFAYQKEQDKIAAEEAERQRLAISNNNSGNKSTSKGVSAGVKAVANKVTGKTTSNTSNAVGKVASATAAVASVDTNSLKLCAKMLGISNISASQADKLVREGVLKEIEVNGRVGWTVMPKYATQKYLPTLVKKKLGLIK